MLHAPDPDEHFVQMPLVSGPRTTAAQALGEAIAKFHAPPSNGLIGDDDTTFGQKELNIPQTEAKHVIQPDGMADDLGRKTVSVVRVGRGRHAASLAGLRPDCQLRLTWQCPWRRA